MKQIEDAKAAARKKNRVGRSPRRSVMYRSRNQRGKGQMTDSSSVDKFRVNAGGTQVREEMKSKSTGFLGSEERSRSNSKEKQKQPRKFHAYE